MHIAAQYLAAAGISFLEKQPDDSHTNVGFSVEDRTLFSRSLLSSGITLQLVTTVFLWNGSPMGNSSAIWRWMENRISRF